MTTLTIEWGPWWRMTHREVILCDSVVDALKQAKHHPAVKDGPTKITIVTDK